MRTNPAVSARIVFCLSLLMPQFLASQIPQALGRLQITSTPSGASITINGSLRNEKTPVTVAVTPAVYKVKVGTCAEQTVRVSAGETRNVDCAQ
jgi:hypothetical protein